MEETQKNETVSEMQLSASQKKESEYKEELEKQSAILELSEKLFEYAMKDQWHEVVEAYKHKPESREAKITEAEDTALHLAVSGGKLEFVNELVETLRDNSSNALRAKNKRGNTPLHTAAALGNARMCHVMASKDWNLIAERNKKNETPLYLAAHFGHKDAFLCLYFSYQGNRSDMCSRDENGNTILHAAINGEHFDLAFQIICKYPKIVNAVNVNGLSPLHILATKSNAFKSGSRLGWLGRLIYKCIIVDEMKDETYDSKDYLKRFEEKGSVDQCFPQNYATCARFFQMFVGVTCYGMPSLVEIFSVGGRCFLSLVNCNKKQTQSIIDEENPQATSKVTQGESSVYQKNTESKNSCNGAKGLTDTTIGSNPEVREDIPRDESFSEEHRKVGHLPGNYATFTRFFKFVVKLMMVFLGLGFQRIKKIETKKQRYTWASQVMIKLIENASMYKYSGGGQNGSGIGHRMTEDFPYNPSLMGSPSRQASINGIDKASSLETSDNREHQSETDSSKKEENATPMEKLLGNYLITGTVDSKALKHDVTMKFEKKVSTESTNPKTPLLIAASRGITEMVEKILEKFPVAIQDMDDENKNVILLAVENRQTHTFRFLIERKRIHESVFLHWDSHGNNALHLAATYGHYRPWLIPGSALQMQWELKWYKFVKKSMSKHSLNHYNKKGQTPKQIFTETHKVLIKDASEWLTKTSESCSLIAALIATVAFATSANIPGGVSQETGEPVLRNEPAFGVFAISSIVALCFSVTALVFFLAILTSRFEEKDFAEKLPRKLILGLTSLFASIAAMLISFCAGHFFELRDKLKFAAFPIYTATCLPISLFALAQLPLYFDLLWAICQKVPQRGYNELGS